MGTFAELGLKWGAPDGTRDNSDFWEVELPAMMKELAADLDEGQRFDAVIVDEEGSWTALALAEALLDAGSAVTLLCAEPALFWRVPVYSKPARLNRLRAKGFPVQLLT